MDDCFHRRSSFRLLGHSLSTGGIKFTQRRSQAKGHRTDRQKDYKNGDEECFGSLHVFPSAKGTTSPSQTPQSYGIYSNKGS
jgi:hypothetical protein